MNTIKQMQDDISLAGTDGYRTRILDRAAGERLRDSGAVFIEGIGHCGKTSSARKLSGSVLLLRDPSGNFRNRMLAEMEPALALRGAATRLIDEWQEAPAVLDAAAAAASVQGTGRQFIFTCSSLPREKEEPHGVLDRMPHLRLRTMTLSETGDSDGSVSLSSLFDGTFRPHMTGGISLSRLAGLIVRGGWPESLGVSGEKAAVLPQQYLRDILGRAEAGPDGIRRDRGKILALLRALARNESRCVSERGLRRDILNHDRVSVSNPTVLSYLDVLRRLFLTDDQPAFSNYVRTSVRQKKMAKRHLADPSLACALLGLDAAGLIDDLSTMGFMFEALCEHDLRVYAESSGGRLFHYQDYQEKSIDAVVEMNDGRWGAFDIRLGANEIDDAAGSLISLRKSIAKDANGRLTEFLCVICGLSEAAYVRPDGVFVIPITSLRP